MSMPQYPGGPGAPQGGYPGAPYPGQGGPNPQTGYGMQAAQAPQAAPVPTPAGPKGPSVMSALGAPSAHAPKALWIGVLIILVSFALKQIFVDISLFSAGGMVSGEQLQLKQRAELAEIDSALDAIENEIADLEDDKPEFDSDDVEGSTEKKEKHDEKLAKLQKDRAEKSKDLEPKRAAVRKEYRQKIREASRSSIGSSASALGQLKLTLMAKILLDLMKLAGAAMCVLSALSIAVDPEQSTGAKAYGAVIGGIAFLSAALGGLYALLG
jgi:hypothetical protein